MISTNVVLHTNGTGYWSTHTRAVRVIGYELGYVSQNADFGELRVYFDESTWDVTDHGLIYTDSQFLSELREFLETQGLNPEGVNYSEQGMQAEDYVSLDVGEQFIASYVSTQQLTA